MSERLVFFTGPSGAGKSATAAAFVAARPTPTAFIESDQIRGIVRLGTFSAVNASETREHGRVGEYFHLGARACAALVRTYLADGIDCVVNSLRGFAPPPPWAGEWDELDELDPLFVVLFPSLDSCITRAAGRARSGETAPDVAKSHGFDWLAWSTHPRAHIIDTSEMTLDQVVVAVTQLVDRP
jgi:hypothetical protein